MWKVTSHKEPKGQQDIQLKMLIKEMAEYTYATYAQQFETAFKSLIETEIKPTNSFKPSLMYKVTPRNQKSVEVWKMTVQGDFKEKLYTLEFVE